MIILGFDSDYDNNNKKIFSEGETSLGVKRPGREADHSPPPKAEVKE
jgi:hypothetical protein